MTTTVMKTHHMGIPYQEIVKELEERLENVRSQPYSPIDKSIGRMLVINEHHLEMLLERQCKDNGKYVAVELIGFALFNLTKGNLAATETLLRKAYIALTGEEWDAMFGGEDDPA